ncbi:hypothetical protein DVA85_05545 [Acinetobacter sp. RIT592]|nr:hypothetical protein DVA85_05545 [Acinetobacter sp. RIT592]
MKLLWLIKKGAKSHRFLEEKCTILLTTVYASCEWAGVGNLGILGLSAQGVEKGYSHKEDEAE